MNVTAAIDWLNENCATRMDNLQQGGGSTMLLATYPHSLPFGSLLAYWVTIYFLPKILANSPERKLTFIMSLWNGFLFLISFVIFLGVGIPYLEDIRTRGLFDVFCDPNQTHYSVASLKLFWSYLFAFTKYLELFDTVFLIIRKPRQPLSFLHWYHHSTVLLFTWYCEYYRFVPGFIFMLVNALVHTFMYFYYFLTGLGYRPSWAMALTIAQIVQMVIGIITNTYWMYLYKSGTNCACDAPEIMMWSCIVLYGSYLLLFVKFFVERYLFKKEAKAQPEHTKGKGYISPAKKKPVKAD